MLPNACFAAEGEAVDFEVVLFQPPTTFFNLFMKELTTLLPFSEDWTEKVRSVQRNQSSSIAAAARLRGSGIEVKQKATKRAEPGK